MSPRIIFYYQTFSGLKNIEGTTHIHLASIHFGYDAKDKEYIHLNDFSPYDKKFDSVWKELEEAKDKYNIKVILMVGGAGGAFGDYQKNPILYYNFLRKLIQTKKNIIDGVDLDVEEPLDYGVLKNLIINLKNDFGPDFLISLAPVSFALETDTPGMGGFYYRQLEDDLGILINYYNTQFYYDYNNSSYDKVVKNGYSSDKIIFGAIDSTPIDQQVIQVTNLKNKYGDKFGGVFIWEYCNAPKDWSKKMCSIIT